MSTTGKVQRNSTFHYLDSQRKHHFFVLWTPPKQLNALLSLPLYVGMCRIPNAFPVKHSRGPYFFDQSQERSPSAYNANNFYLLVL